MEDQVSGFKFLILYIRHKKYRFKGRFNTRVIVLQNTSGSAIKSDAVSRDVVKKVFRLHCLQERQKKAALKVSFIYTLYFARGATHLLKAYAVIRQVIFVT